MAVIVCLETSAPYTPARWAAISPCVSPFRRQGNHHVLDPGQPPLPLGDDFRLEAGIPVPGHADFHRPGLGEHGLCAVAVTGIPAITAFRRVPGIAEVIV
jgi:hypothetical protein